MPIRSYKLKLTIDQRERAKQLREAMWNTHCVLNTAIAEFERLLLLLRGQAYDRSTKDGVESVSAETVRAEMLELARASQRANGATDQPGSDDEVLGSLCELFQHMAKDKNAALAFLSALYDPDCTTGEMAFNFVNDPPWMAPLRAAEAPFLTANQEPAQTARQTKKAEKLQAVTAGRTKAAKAAHGAKAAKQSKKQREEARQAAMLTAAQSMLAEATAWVTANPWVSRTGGAHAFWYRTYMKDSQNARWMVLFADYITTARQKTTEGWVALLRRLKLDLKVLPLQLRPPIASKLRTRLGVLSGWDRMAFGKAAEHILSWDSYDHNTTVDYLKLRQRTENFRTKHLGAHGTIVAALQTYEQQRHIELMEHGMATADRPFRLNRRMVRKWDDVQQAWMQVLEDAEGQPVGADELWHAAAVIQTDDQREYGDPHFYGWLVLPANRLIWMGNDARFAVKHFAIWRDLQARLQVKKQRAAYTAPDARMHPRWTAYDAPGKSAPTYSLSLVDGQLTMELPLLAEAPDGMLDMRSESFRVLPSRQIKWLGIESWKDAKKKHPSRVRFEGTMSLLDREDVPTRELSRGELKELELRFDRSFLEATQPTRLVHGEIGNVFVSVPIDVDHRLGAGTCGWVVDGKVVPDSAEFHFSSGLATPKEDHKAKVQAGFRVMAVDLRMRRLAACSVFELRAERGDDLAFATDTPFFANHLGSFVLEMTGDSPTVDGLAARSAAKQDLRSVRRGKSGLRRLNGVLAEDDPQKRVTIVASLIEGWRLENPSPLLASLMPPPSIRDLLDLVSRRAGWQHAVRECLAEWESQLAQAISRWRRDDAKKQKDREYAGGHSLWHVEYLTNVRKVMMSWSLRSRPMGDVRRPCLKGGSFMAGMLRHIDHLKDFHIKAGADLIVNRARGLTRRADGVWVQTHEPCRLIVFEDLARYRMASDRPKYENRNLMAWAHRELVRTVTLQAEMFGIRVATVGAGFSSRMHGATGAPGILCRRLSPADLQQDWVQHRLERLGIEDAQPGDLLPDDGGELFVTLDANSRPLEVEYNVNAALQLARRFWTRHADAYRVVVQPIEGGDWVPMPDQGTRLTGSLVATYGSRWLRFSAADEGYTVAVDASQRPADTREDVVGSDDDLAEAAMAEEEAQEASGARRSLFRDVTGYVIRDDRWFPYQDFWRMVERRVLEASGARFDAPLRLMTPTR